MVREFFRKLAMSALLLDSKVFLSGNENIPSTKVASNGIRSRTFGVQVHHFLLNYCGIK